jgi:predicted nuclease with TOPRIM domain
MSLDETHHALMHFEGELRAFNERLRACHSEVRRLHSEVDGLWQDELRRTYDGLIAELEQPLELYVTTQAERYEQFLAGKLKELRFYLFGGE